MLSNGNGFDNGDDNGEITHGELVGGPRYTPTHQRILMLLSDGLPHSLQELMECTDDGEFCSRKNIHTHLSMLRKKLQPRGEDIMCRRSGKDFLYRHVLLVGKFSDS
jgi:hypothetical protein